jgi:hypothetical protein
MPPRRRVAPRAPHTSARALSWAGLFVGAVASGGCGAAIYTVDVVSAESVVAEAEQAGAAELAPYEYYAAREYLTEAHEEASEASYEDALRYAQAAGRLGREARELAQRRRDERAADTERSQRTSERGSR